MPGCTDVRASNRNRSATSDDGSCIVDQCYWKLHNCHPAALCKVLPLSQQRPPGLYRCECQPGYTGSGVTCTKSVLGCTNRSALNFEKLARPKTPQQNKTKPRLGLCSALLIFFKRRWSSVQVTPPRL